MLSGGGRGGFSSMALLTPRILSYIMLDKFSDGGVGCDESDNRFFDHSAIPDDF